MPNSNGIKIIDYFGKPPTYNKLINSLNRIKKYINKRFGHDLIFKNVKLITSHIKYEDLYDKFSKRKGQIYISTIFNYNFSCKKCNINFQAGCGSGYFYKNKIDWEFMSDDWDIDIPRYHCNGWIIKKYLE